MQNRSSSATLRSILDSFGESCCLKGSLPISLPNSCNLWKRQLWKSYFASAVRFSTSSLSLRVASETPIFSPSDGLLLVSRECVCAASEKKSKCSRELPYIGVGPTPKFGSETFCLSKFVCPFLFGLSVYLQEKRGIGREAACSTSFFNLGWACLGRCVCV